MLENLMFAVFILHRLYSDRDDISKDIAHHVLNRQKLRRHGSFGKTSAQFAYGLVHRRGELS